MTLSFWDQWRKDWVA